jgi:quinol monooxygenase YgiN
MRYKILLSLICHSLLLIIAKGQSNDPYVRVAKIIVDSSQLSSYMHFLKEGVETAMQQEPGVLRMYAVAEKNHPHRITIIETYASKAAYELHIQTAHFKRYKQGTLHMVKFLELIDVEPLFLAAKIP